jgi:hypothetical protein
VRLVVTDDLRRTRVTVAFRVLLALPHLVWLAVWGIVAMLALVANWFATLARGRSPAGLHEFLATYLRYSTHVSAYLLLAADPFPPFGGKPGYPVDLEVDAPERQRRWKVLLRLVLAIPAFAVGTILQNLAFVLAFFGWFVALATGRMAEGMRDFETFALRYQMQTQAYASLVTPRYPPFTYVPSDR